jgi:hypothetical protein
MTQALITAEMLTAHAARAFSDDDAWLSAFDRERDRWLQDYRRLTALVLWLAGHPALFRPALSLLQRAPNMFSHLLGVAGGTRRLWGGAPRQSAVLRRTPRPLLH